MSDNKRLVTFENFVSRFEEITLPITIGTETHLDISSQIDPLPVEMIETFILQRTDFPELDEFTEVVPVMKVADTTDFHALILWRAALLEYEYWLMTYDKRGTFLDKKRIAGTKALKDVLLQAVVTINQDWSILIVQGGVSTTDRSGFDAAKTLNYHYQILEDGHIQEDLTESLGEN